MVYDYLIASENVSFSKDCMILGFSFFVSLFQHCLIYLTYININTFKMLLFFQLSRLFPYRLIFVSINFRIDQFLYPSIFVSINFRIDQFSYRSIFASINYRRLIFVRCFIIRSFFADPF